jgi:hypothetical protein
MRLTLFLAASVTISQVAAATQNYALAFQTSIRWFEAQVSGVKPSWSTISWRGDSALLDGKDHGIDLTGGKSLLSFEDYLQYYIIVTKPLSVDFNEI